MEFTIKKFNDVWLDNGLVTFIQIIVDIIEDDEENEIISDIQIKPDSFFYKINDSEKFIKKLSNKIKGKIKNLIVLDQDKKTLEEKEYKKDFVLIQEKKKLRGKVALKENIFDENKTEKIIREIYNNLSEGNKVCFFCGRKFKKNIKNLQQASYPYVTKIKTLSGVRTGKDIKLSEYISNYCPHCYLIGILEWLDDSLVYRNIPKEKSIIILPQSNNIIDLVDLKNDYVGILNNEKRWSNIRIDIEKQEVENPPNKFSTFISFYENYLRFIEREKYSNKWYITEIPNGSVKNPKFFEIEFDKEIYNLLKTLIKNNKNLFFRKFVKEFYPFNNDTKKGIKNDKLEKELHELLCEAIIKNDFKKFANAFLPKKGIYIVISKGAYEVLDNIIKIWRLYKMEEKEKKEFLKILKSAGESIANLIGNRIGLFFKLEKSKDSSEFLKILQEITRRLTIDKYKFETNFDKYEKMDHDNKSKIYINLYNIDKITEKIYTAKEDKKQFEDIKSILLIYASLKMGRKF